MHFKALAGWILAITFLHPVSAENASREDFVAFDNYNQWGLMISPGIATQRIQVSDKYGDITIEPRPVYSSSLGLEYNFVPTNKWSVIAGFYVGFTQTLKFNYKIKAEDIPVSRSEGINSVDHPLSVTYLPFATIPLKLEYKIGVSDRLYLNFIYGNHLYLIPSSLHSISSSVSEDEWTEQIPVFSSVAYTEDEVLQGAVLFSSGLYFALDNILLKANITYSRRYRDLFTGEYRFENLVESEPSGGNLHFKGDFIGLSLTAFISREWKLTFVE